MNTKHLAELARAATPGPISVIDGYYPSFKELSGLSFKVSVVMWAADLTEADYLKRDADLNYMAAAYNALPELLAANEALTKERDALAKDAERLEWLEKSLFGTAWNGVVGSGCKTTWVILPDYRHTVQGMVNGDIKPNFREAIDAAIAARSATP